MKFFRRLETVKALTFDLDDTLYDNAPVIRQLEVKLSSWLNKYHPLTADQSALWWKAIKRDLAKDDPWLIQDVTLWRFKVIKEGLYRLGYDDQKAKLSAEEAMEWVLKWRSDICIPRESHDVLTVLSKQVPLVAITNGNVDIEQIGLASYFSLVLKAGSDGFAKPDSDMFQKAQRFLGFSHHNILHVGDHLNSDVVGAKQSGFQACWYNNCFQDSYQSSKARLLPDVEISKLKQLLMLHYG
jgi:putative hydrolase of the HAD superfamily